MKGLGRISGVPNRCGLTILLYIILFAVSCDLNKDENGIVKEDGMTWVETGKGEGDSTAYYVSPSGNDNSAGTRSDRPLRTLVRAFQSVRPGGTIHVMPGTYVESIAINNGGGSSAFITVKGYEGIPVLDGKNELPAGIYCSSCTHFIFENLKIKNYTDFGIGASLSSHITFRKLQVEENGHKVQLLDWELEGYGIHVDDSHHIVIDNNDVYRNGPEPQVIPDRIMGTGINTFNIMNAEITSNRSHHNIGGGILVEDSRHVLVENNEIYSNDLDATVDEWWDGGIWLDGGGDVTIRNNVFRDNLGPGIQISDEDRQSPTGYILENNDSHSNYYGIFIWNFGTTGWPDSTILRRKGNRIENNTKEDIWIVNWME
ncbi:hypothetical protein BVY01_05040 [bacterium I07]|nr:hypothetical protein BVY01_05040 [bacterium I07]